MNGSLIKSAFTYFLVCILVADATLQAQSLKISPDKRFIINEKGDPFFYLGDTAWELFHRLNREEAEHYLKDRKAKGFNVIQAVVLAELSGLKDLSPYGDLPLHSLDPTTPNEA